MSAFCPLCLSKGRKTVLKYFQVNLSEATRMCADAKCPYPFGLTYTDTFIQQNFMDMLKDDSIKLGMESLQDPGTPS
ncbi:hypothetical protein Cfor_07790 [Coptotermes formosanus]|uniref:Uncharacterized protein n=1 Tax=Coptotermes formosanus TaxID=36987 RepID=A0A6L2PE30_COPFO|nr:hypothetical protein Cfor_07790 [Coptotermes formosanus]